MRRIRLLPMAVALNDVGAAIRENLGCDNITPKIAEILHRMMCEVSNLEVEIERIENELDRQIMEEGG